MKVLLRKASVCSSSRSWGGLWTRRNRCRTGKDVHCGPVKSDMQVNCWCSAETEVCFSHYCRFLKINILRSLTYWKQTLSLHVVADAYCLLEVYTVLNSNPSHFGLPNDLQNISSRQSEKSKDKKSKEQQTEQVKPAQGKQVRALLHGLFSCFYNIKNIYIYGIHTCMWINLKSMGVVGALYLFTWVLRFTFKCLHVLFAILRLGLSTLASKQLLLSIWPAARDDTCLQFLSAPGVHIYSHTIALASLRCCTSKKNPPCGNQLSITLLSLSI